MLDSMTLDSDSWLTMLLNPVGLRYHTTHHLFPSLPYHNIRAAHRRLMQELPADSLYHRTVEPCSSSLGSDQQPASAVAPHSRHSPTLHHRHPRVRPHSFDVFSASERTEATAVICFSPIVVFSGVVFSWE